MDFNKLLEAYQDGDSGRSYATIMKWLTGPKYGIDKAIVEKAILSVFNELEQGKSFLAAEGFSAGHHLDQYIRDVALKLRDGWAEEEAVKMEAFFNNLLQTHKEKAVKDFMASREEFQKALNWFQRFIKWLFRI